MRPAVQLVAIAVALCCTLLASSEGAHAQRKRRSAPAAAPTVSSAPADEAPASAEPVQAAPAIDEVAGGSPEAAAVVDGSAPAQASPAAKPASDEGIEQARAVREELSSVMDELVSARARAAMLGKSLFKTRVRVVLVNEAADDQILGKVALALDGNPIYRGDGSTLDAKGAKLFEGYAAPGPHVLTVEIEQRARQDDAYRYTQTTSLRFMVPRGTQTDVRLVLDDDSDIAEDFRDDLEGEYDMRLRMQVEAKALGGS